MKYVLKPLVAGVVVVLGSLSFASVSSAAAPEIDRSDFFVEFTFADRCGEGADIILSSSGNATEISFSEDGEVTRIVSPRNSSITYTRSDTGNSATLRINRMTIEKPADGTFESSGGLMLTLPGIGVVGASTGRFITVDGEVTFQAGQDILPEGLFDQLCESLA